MVRTENYFPEDLEIPVTEVMMFHCNKNKKHNLS